jgi:hypothetical protein
VSGGVAAAQERGGGGGSGPAGRVAGAGGEDGEKIRGSRSADLLNRRCAISALGGPGAVPLGGEPAAARAGPEGALKVHPQVFTTPSGYTGSPELGFLQGK